jgi:hypothetical protein
MPFAEKDIKRVMIIRVFFLIPVRENVCPLVKSLTGRVQKYR